MRLARVEAENVKPIAESVLGVYLAEVTHGAADLVEAVIYDGREIEMGTAIADLIDVLYGLARQVNISRGELDTLRNQRTYDYGDYGLMVFDG